MAAHGALQQALPELIDRMHQQPVSSDLLQVGDRIVFTLCAQRVFQSLFGSLSEPSGQRMRFRHKRIARQCDQTRAIVRQLGLYQLAAASSSEH